MLKSFSNPLLQNSVPLGIALFILFTQNAHACATCSFNDESNNYFLVMIVFMTSLPVVFIGAVVYYLKKQREKNENQP